MKFLQTFRARLMIILAVLLIATLGVQYYLNLQNIEESERLREKQEQSLVAGIILGVNSVTSNDRLSVLVNREGQPFFDGKVKERIKDIIVIDNNWKINDSLSPDYLPTEDDDGKTVKINLKEVTNFPPLVNDYRLGADSSHFPNASSQEVNNDREAHAIPIETSDGRWYVMVILKTDKLLIARKAAQPLVYMLMLLLFSTIITVVLVWRFTRPVTNISEAAQRVAEGDLSVRVPDYRRDDEMGLLTTRFNEMTAELEKKSELENKLKEAEKSAVVGRLGSAIAHEIRNPLNYINLTLDHLRAKFKPEDDARKETFEKLTSQLKSEVARINQQITDFLSYSRPPKLNRQPTDVWQVVNNSLRIAKVQAAELNIDVNVSVEDALPPISGDAEFLRSVFNNLLINAVQSMEATGGKLDVNLSTEKDFVKIEITDTGKGIPAENLEKIFEPYFSTKETGTGLGLAIVKKVIDEHNGTIEVESTVGEGTKFTVKLTKA